MISSTVYLNFRNADIKNYVTNCCTQFVPLSVPQELANDERVENISRLFNMMNGKLSDAHAMLGFISFSLSQTDVNFSMGTKKVVLKINKVF